MKNPITNQLSIFAIIACATVSMALKSEAAAGAHGPSENQRIAVTQEQVARLGIKVSKATLGSVRREIRVPGEIKVKAGQMAYVVPIIPGVVQEISADLGHHVTKGQELAVISSRNLAEAKADYLALAERLQLTEQNYNREARLREKKVSAEQDFLAAKQALAEAKILRNNARQKLITYGVDPSALPQLGTQSDAAFSRYSIISPLEGMVIDEQIVRGQVVSDQAEVFVIADLSTVWVDLAISQDTVSEVKAGQTVLVKLSDTVQSEVSIEFVSAVADVDTRTILARATLENPHGKFRPGTFIDADILVPSKENAVVIPKASVQLVNDRPCVFVWGNADFEVREVVVGVTDGQQIEIVQGVQADELVASENAFHLKAEAVKSAETAFGGHGHAH